MDLLADAHAMRDDLTQLRHALHQEPEIGLQLPRTQERVLDALAGLPLEISTGTMTTSVTAVLRGTYAGHDPAPAVLLRGDMDALPVQEQVDLPYRSRLDGAMHACGHDLHIAMLVGAARLLSAHRDHLAGDVVFMFQPGEEGHDGAGVMIDEGVLDAAGRRADAAYGIHVFSAAIPHGHFHTRPGTIMAASDELHVTVHGTGGHGSAPHRAKDPVPAIAHMVTALQTMVTRRFDAFDPVILSVGQLHAGTKANIIPDQARLEATIRTFSEAARSQLQAEAPRLIEHIAQAHGLEATADYIRQYPVTINDNEETAFAAETIQEVFGTSRYKQMRDPIGAAEDFSRVLAAVPGAFIFLGATPPDLDPDGAPFNHSPLARYDDAVLPDGAAAHAELAVRRLTRPRPTTPSPTAP